MKNYLTFNLILLFNFLLIGKTIAQTNQIVSNDTPVNAINFPGGCSYTWVNDNPSIGLAASGSGNIASFTAKNTSNTPIIATITATPVTGGFAYISNTYANTVSVISVAEQKVVATIPVQSNPVGIALTADGSKAFVGNSFSRSVSVINTLTNAVIDNITTSDYTISICVNKDGSKLYVANYNNQTISVYNTVTKNLIATIPAGEGPYNICLSPDESRLYVTNNNFRHNNPTTVTIINTLTNSMITAVTVGAQPEGIAINKDGSRVYAVNMISNSFSVINTATNTVIETIPVNGNPHGIVLSPDDKIMYTRDAFNKQLLATNLLTKVVKATPITGSSSMGLGISSDGLFVYIPNPVGDNVSVVNTVTNMQIATILVQRAPNVSGNFVSAALSCSPVSFTITVNPDPSLAAGIVSGSITACLGTVSSNMQQFTVSGSYLTSNVIATAPSGFELSLQQGNSYGSTVSIPSVNGTIVGTTVYVRSSSSATAGSNTGNVVLTSTGLSNKTVPVASTINVLPTVNSLPNQQVKNGVITGTVVFSGTAGHYNWTNNSPGIGLAASGIDDIAAFIAINNGNNTVIATITATPVNNSGCEGAPVVFTITIDPNDPILAIGNISGSIIACLGTASLNMQQFTVSGSHLKTNVIATAPAGFELSLQSGSGYGNTVSIPSVNGAISGTIVYVRSSNSAPTGSNTGDVVLTSTGLANKTISVTATTNPLPTVNNIPNQQLKNGATTNAIIFTGTADHYNWTNNSPGIGLALSGKGDIFNFAAVNNSNKAITATITATPVNNSGCEGSPVTFTIIVESDTPLQPPKLTIPNAFTPNGDGINDTWIIQNLSTYISATVKVFNRYGDIVFTSTGYTKPWDGKVNNQDIPTGVYYYVINTNIGGGVISGNLTIIR